MHTYIYLQQSTLLYVSYIVFIALLGLCLGSFSNVIIAYEPIWAIGTGENASPIQAEEIHAFIRSIVSDKYGSESAEDLLIVYGGSCNPSNAKDIFAESNIDGGLVGGASLSANSFVEIIKSF